MPIPSCMSHAKIYVHTLTAEWTHWKQMQSRMRGLSARSQLLPKHSGDEIDTYRRQLSKNILEHKREIVLLQFVASSGKFYIVFTFPHICSQHDTHLCGYFTEYSFCVDVETDQSMTCFVRRVQIAPPTEEERGPIPCYHKTRQVNIFEGKLSCGATCVSIECSCKFALRVESGLMTWNFFSIFRMNERFVEWTSELSNESSPQGFEAQRASSSCTQ